MHGSTTHVIQKDVLLVESMNCVDLMTLLTWARFKGEGGQGVSLGLYKIEITILLKHFFL
jgi:hypothetical protein